MSGAGRSAAADVLEDLGWFVVDNVPPQLLTALIDLLGTGDGRPRVAVVVDVRSGSFFTALRDALDALHERDLRPTVLFLEAGDDTLVRRYDSVRRPHPLQGEGRVLDGIRRERIMLAELRATADLVIDTSTLNVHELAAKILNAFAPSERTALRATVLSFGFKYGIPVDADLVADVRFLPNPHWVPDLRPHTGRDPDVRGYVLGQELAGDFLDTYEELLRIVSDGYLREGKRFLTLAVGCTGGKHRSVVMSEELASRLRTGGVETLVVHRDLGRE